MAGNNGPRIVGYDPNTGAPIYSNPSSDGKKIIKGVLIGAIVLVLGIVGWLIYDKFFNLEKVDLFIYDEGITTSGYSGFGTLDSHIESYMGEYIGEPGYANQFYNSVTYTADKTEGLSNGDTVTITASYDKNLARKARIRVKSDKKEYKVKDLGERYDPTGKDIDQEDVAAIRNYMNDYMARSVNDGYGNGRVDGLEKLFYVGSTTSDEYDEFVDQMIGVYKVTYTDSWDGSTDVDFIELTMYPINKGLNYKDNIDQLVEDGVLYLDEGYGVDTVAEAVNDIKTTHNRDTVTEFKTQ